MLLKLVDCVDRVHEFEIGNLEDISSIYIKVVSGDECARVGYQNGDLKYIDSSYFDEKLERLFFEGNYPVYNGEVNLLNNEKWLCSDNSYDRMIIAEE